MDLQEYINKTDKVVKSIENFNNGETMVKLAITACTLIRDRVINKGEDAKGSKYKPYSTKAMLMNCSSVPDGKCKLFLGTKTQQKERKKRSEYEKYLAAEAGEFETRWVTLKRKGRLIRLFELSGGYKEFRQKLGFQVDHVDFMRSGKMWGNILVTDKSSPGLLSADGDHIKGIARIGPRSDEQKKILEGNERKRGAILDLSENEKDYLKKQYGFELLDIYRENGLE